MNKKNTKKYNARIERNYYMSLKANCEMLIELIDNNITVHESYIGYQKRFDKRAIKFLKKNNENF